MSANTRCLLIMAVSVLAIICVVAPVLGWWSVLIVLASIGLAVALCKHVLQPWIDKGSK